MKKFLICLLTLAMVLSMVACGNETTTESTGASVPETTEAPAANYEGTMEALLNALNEKAVIEELMTMVATADPADMEMFTYMTGLTDASLVSDVAICEAMVGSIAYSVGAYRVAEGQDVAAVANTVLEGLNPAKWICVQADDVQVLAAGDVILTVMVDSSLAPNYSADLTAAFTELVGAPTVSLTK